MFREMLRKKQQLTETAVRAGAGTQRREDCE